jgi:hypothetical protein
LLNNRVQIEFGLQFRTELHKPIPRTKKPLRQRAADMSGKLSFAINPYTALVNAPDGAGQSFLLQHCHLLCPIGNRRADIIMCEGRILTQNFCFFMLIGKIVKNCRDKNSSTGHASLTMTYRRINRYIISPVHNVSSISFVA